MSKVYLINFTGTVGKPVADADLTARQQLMNDVAIQLGNIDDAIAWTRGDLLNTDFYQTNRYILDQARGAGFWSWKPYIILETLKKLGPNDWVVYSDIGKPFRRNDQSRAGNAKIGNVLDTPVDDGIAYAQNNQGFTPGIWIPHYGNTKVWAKRDCFVGMGCDYPEYHNSGHVQAGYSIWSNSEASRDFLKQWLKWCQVAAIITDDANIYGKPNFDEFRDHRHDQAIMTNLVIKNNIELFGPRETTMSGFRDFNLILRHMMLKGTLSAAVARIAPLFNANTAKLPAWLSDVIHLFILPSIELNRSVWRVQSGDDEIWQEAFSNVELTLNSKISIAQKFGAIFAHKFTQESQQIQQLGILYNQLAPGGTLIIGPINGSDKDTPSTTGSFSQLLNWIDVNQCFPKNMCSIKDQQRNAITLGNSANPVIAWGANGKGGYAFFRKPRISLI